MLPLGNRIIRFAVGSRRIVQQTIFSKETSQGNYEFRQMSTDDDSPDYNHPARKTFRILGDDIKKLGRRFIPNKAPPIPSGLSEGTHEFEQHLSKYKNPDDELFQTHCDVLIVGGGGIGSSIAYWVKKKVRTGLNIVVLEKDSTYKEASTVLSVGGLRQQFSLPENIQMSLYGADFIRNIHEYLGPEVAVNFTPHGYLTLATENGAETLTRNSRLQNELGARNELLSQRKLKERFPWLNTEGIALGCHGLEKEGWFDPWALLSGFRRKAKELGAHYVDGELVEFEFLNRPDTYVEGVPPGEFEGLDKAIIKMPDGERRTVKFGLCVIAAGAQSGAVAELARIGNGRGLLSVPLPVEPRKRYVYVFKCQGENEPSLNTPLTIDPTNLYFRRDGLGGNYLTGLSPSSDKEPSCDSLDVDYEYFDTNVWPILAKRVPAFESIKVQSAWAGFYEFNKFDENGILGPHPYYTNLYIATGFSGHGIQQTPAVGRAISELIVDGFYRTIDLTRLGFDRIIVDQPMHEVNIV